MATRKTMEIAPHYTPTYQVELEWNGIQPNDPVRVQGERGEFTFIKIHTRQGEVTDVIVHGGTNGNKSIRAFYPHRVSAIRKRKRRTASED